MRYEQQAKESEQAELAKTVIEKVLKSIQDERTQREILANAITDVERASSYFIWSPSRCRLCAVRRVG